MAEGGEEQAGKNVVPAIMLTASVETWPGPRGLGRGEREGSGRQEQLAFWAKSPGLARAP